MKRIIPLLLMIALSRTAAAQQPPDLYQAILSCDSLLFDIGFNTCNIRQFELLLSDSFEFYHDKGGPADKQKFISDLKGGLCKNPATYQSRRELLPGTTRIYPLYSQGTLYGAVQYGEHRFFEQQAGKPETAGSTAKFTHLWLLQQGAWKLHRSLSYDHQDTAAATDIFNNDAAMEQWLQDNKVPALALGIIAHGKLQQIKTYGRMQDNMPVAYNTIFNVASLTKPLTAMVALQLASQGLWNLDEPLYAYWTDPDIAQDPRHKQLTTRLVLSHQTGFPNWRQLNADKKLAFDFDPGTRYQYSGEGLEYLRKALENKFRKPLDQLAAKLVLGPWNMRDTKYTWQQADTARIAWGYDKEGHAYPPVRNTAPNAADDLLTTIEDYGSFLVHIMDGAGLSPQVFAEMTAQQVKTKEHKYFGLGMEIYDLGNGDYALSHGGADAGVQAIAFILPKTKQGLLIFTNVDDGWKLYERLIGHYLGEQGRRIIDIEMK